MLPLFHPFSELTFQSTTENFGQLGNFPSTSCLCILGSDPPSLSCLPATPLLIDCGCGCRSNPPSEVPSAPQDGIFPMPSYIYGYLIAADDKIIAL